MDWGDGGFINDSVADEPQQLTSSVTVGGDDKNKAIAAVSISQIAKLTRPNEGLVIHGKKIYHVNLVAMIHEIVDMNPQKVHLLLDDYTSGGPLEATHIIGDSGTPGDDPSLSMFEDNLNRSSEQPKPLHSLKQGDYIRCIGVVKFSQDKPNLVAYNMRYIDDPNEITMHILEVIRDSMYYERLQAGGGMPPVMKEEKHTTTNYQQQTRNEFGKLSTRDKHLLKFLRERAQDTGMSLDDIAANLKAFSRKDIEESLALLSSEGLCWQGDSEDVWCVNPAD